jgi:hypothetical protein
MAKLTDAEILARIEQEERIGYGINDDTLANDRAKAIDYYLGEPLGNEVEGRSQVVSFDVQDTIEAALPQLIKIFASGDQVIRFDPKGPNDEQAAQQETDYINHLVMEKNRGFEVLYTWFKDALLSKNGYVKVYYEESDEVETENYRGLTEAQLLKLTQDENVSILEHESYIDQMQFDMMQQQFQQQMQQYQMMAQQAMQNGQPAPPPPQEPQPPMLHDVKIEVRETRGCIEIENVAPENIIVSVDTSGVSLQESRFIQHREMMSKSEAKEYGWKNADDAGDIDTDNFQVESNARDLYNEQYDRVNEEQDEIFIRDTYIKIDGERWRYVIAGTQIVHREKVEYVPFACLTPMLMPHRHIGRSYADLTMDIQLVKTALIRGQLDNMYLSNNGRYAISDRVNLEDMLTSRPGGVVRVQGEPGTAIMPLQHTPFPPTSFTMVEYLDSMKEKRTGVTAYNQGLDADSLNKTATGINAIMQASAARLELVARLFAETGVKDMFLLVHKAVRQNYTKPDIIRLRDKWVEVDPREWKNRTDMTINVGLGTGNKDMQLMHIQTILAAQQQFGAMGVVKPVNAYNALVKLTQNAGFKNPEEFWTDPTTQPPPPPPVDPKVQIAQMQMQNDQQKFQAQTQIEQQKAQQNQQQEMMRSQNDMEIERQKLQMQAELERFKAELKAKTDLQIAMMQAEISKQQNEQENAMELRKLLIETQIEMKKTVEEARMAQEGEKNKVMLEGMKAMISNANKPRKVTRDESGRVSGVE